MSSDARGSTSRFDITHPPGPSLEGYIARFTRKYDAGEDVFGEARFVDALLDRGSAILDGGCGTGRTTAGLTRAGHRVLGIDRSPRLVEVARERFPDGRYAVRDLLDVGSDDLVAAGLPERVDAVVLAGNILPCLADGTEAAVIANLVRLLRPGGRLVMGWRTDREYPVERLPADAAAAGLVEVHRFSDWQLSAWRDDALWVVSVLTPTD